MANASASKGRRGKRRTTKKKSGAQVWPWVVALVGVAGAITAYEHGDHVRRWMPSSMHVPSLKLWAAKESQPAERTASSQPTFAHPVPRVGIPAERNDKLDRTEQTAKLDKEATPGSRELVGRNFRGTFYFCGTSGLDNCVADGDVFWFHKQAIRVADISAPASEGARCDGERAKGFAAKVRLRDLLNAGSFELADWPNTDEDSRGRKLRVVIRNGQSIGAQLAREGLVRSAGDAGRSWCG